MLIPTHARPEAIARCVDALARHPDPDARVEVLVGIDGPDQGETRALEGVRAGLDLQVLDAPHAGPAATRNRLVEHARGRLLLLLNDDVIPQPGLLHAHLEAHARRVAPAMVLGSAPFAPTPRDSLFDRLVRETSMIFFYDRMSDEDPARDWGFRHAWTLNLSLPAACVRAVGGFCEALPGAAYEDIELAWRVRERFGAPVLYRPEARVIHEHTYEPEGYLRREESLGRDAWALAMANPACALELFGRDITDEAEIEYSAQFVDRERAGTERLRATFSAWARLPADAAPDALIPALYEHHLALKRWHWRRGHLAAARSCAQSV
ncbi:MAG: glycosyltransferase family 2 protein [Phycisphaerales bacterium JB059]